MDPLGITAGAASLAHIALKVGKELWEFIQDVKVVDQTVLDLQSGLKHVENVCQTVEMHVKQLPQSTEEENVPKDLLYQIESQLRSCTAVVSRINCRLERVERSGTYLAAQAYRQLKLNMAEKEIMESNREIQSHILHLQLILQLINLHAIHIAPKLANRHLLDKLEDIQTMLTKGKINPTLQDSATIYLTRGTTLYKNSASSLAGNQQMQIRPKAIASWLDQLHVLHLEELREPIEVRDDELISSPTQSHQTDETTTTSAVDRRSTIPLLFEEEKDEDEDFLVELVQATLAEGKKNYSHKDYYNAEARLVECLSLMRKLPDRLRQGYDFEEIHLLLALCAYQLHDLATAEAALLSVLERNNENNTHAEYRFEVANTLAIVYVRMQKYDVAELHCENARRGRRRLLGRDHDSCYESIALLAIICDLQNSPARAESYRLVIPEEKRTNFVKRYNDIFHRMSLSQETAQEEIRESIPPISSIQAVRPSFLCRSFAAASAAKIVAFGLIQHDDVRNREIAIFSSETLGLMRKIFVSKDTLAYALCFDSTGRRLASAHGGWWYQRWGHKYLPLTINTWDVETGKRLSSFTVNKSACFQPTSMRYINNDQQLILTYKQERYGKGVKTVGMPAPGFVVLSSINGKILKEECYSSNAACYIRGISRDCSRLAISLATGNLTYSLNHFQYIGTIGNGPGAFNTRNEWCELRKTGDIWCSKNDESPRLWLKCDTSCIAYPVSEYWTRITFTPGNIAIIVTKSDVPGHLCLWEPQLGRLRELKYSTDFKDGGKFQALTFSDDAKHLYVERYRDSVVLDVQEQLSLGREVPLAKDVLKDIG